MAQNIALHRLSAGRACDGAQPLTALVQAIALGHPPGKPSHPEAGPQPGNKAGVAGQLAVSRGVGRAPQYQAQVWPGQVEPRPAQTPLCGATAPGAGGLAHRLPH